MIVSRSCVFAARLKVSQGGAGAEPFEHGSGRIQFKRGGLLVTHRPAGLPDEHPDASRLVRRFETLPELERVTKRTERRRRTALRQFDCPLTLRGRRSQHIGIEHLCQLP
jgi:hypothetical protein